MATDLHLRRRSPRTDTVERYGRRARWLHAGTYLTVLTLMFTGIWLLLGHEGAPSPLSRLAGVPDTRLHVWVGWAFVVLLGLGILVGLRGAVVFVLESVRFG